MEKETFTCFLIGLCLTQAGKQLSTGGSLFQKSFIETQHIRLWTYHLGFLSH